MGSQLEVTFINNSSESNLTELPMPWDAKVIDRNTIVEENEVGGVGTDQEMEDSTEVRTWINIWSLATEISHWHILNRITLI